MSGQTDDRSLPDLPPGDRPDRALLALLLAHQRREWPREGRASVEAYIAEQPVLRDDPEAILDLIYQEVLLREEHGESPRLEEYLQRFPELAPQLQLQFELEGALCTRPPPRPDGSDTAQSGFTTSAPSAVQPAIPGYEIVGELGRGGMGVVYKARQLRLNRVVALKMVLAGNHASAEAAIRFMGEAEAVARLHHPNVVQVHAFGDHEGRPYLEMEYVPGGSLADRVDGTPWPAYEAARLVETLAWAIHTVHRLGIVHRDLKPANILLTPDGTPKVADFGLAKWLDVESGLTRTDHVLGTPSYMAPEQTGGGSASIGPTADVYALGAILYELLTGRPPFRAATALETLEQVKSVEPVAPARLRPDLSRDLETVCLKCLQKEPARRYPSAAELAEDLRRFGVGEPIKARPVGVVERAWRWCQREPALAALVAALIVGLLEAATQWWRAEKHLVELGQKSAVIESNLLNERQARASEQEARVRAQERFQLGMEAVDGYSALASEDVLLTDQRLGGLRKRLLDTALKFYTELQKSLEADPTPQAREQLAEAYAQVGKLHDVVWSRDEAVADFRRALEIREALAAASPPNERQKVALIQVYLRIGRAMREIGRLSEALRLFERALAIEEALARDHPTNDSYKEELALCLQNLGGVQLKSDLPDEAIRSYERALAIREALARDDPASPSSQGDLAWCQHQLGMALEAVGRTEEASRRVTQAVAAFEDLVRADPASDLYRERLAACLTDLANLQRRAGAPAARQSFERVVAIREALARDHPTSYHFQIDLTAIYPNLAIEQATAGHLDEALITIRKAEHNTGAAHSVNPITIYNVACAYAQFSACLQRVETDVRPTERREPEEYAERAIEVLRRAIAAGYSNFPLIRRDVDLDPLRQRRDFQELLMDVSFPADPFGSQERH
jgi:tetratricopeptide (TPR) repeat protein/tRNA A-37 threonylcarbamoyl transferase component Bud32